MPKMKTHKGAQKRFKMNGAGKVLQTRQMASHLRRNRSARVLRQLDKTVTMHKANAKRVLKKLLPNGV